jgi:WD40 repeat protein
MMARIEIVPAIGQFGRTSVAFSPDGRFAWSSTHAVKLWERASGRLIRTFYDPAGMSPLALSPDGRRLATGGWRRGNLQLWDVSSGALLRVFADDFASELALLKDAYLTPIAAIAFSPDGTRLLAGRRNLLNLWDVGSGQLLFEEMVWGELNAVAFSPDGAHFLVASRTGLELRDAATGESVRALSANSAGSGNWEAAATIAFAPDGARALSVQGSALSIWDIAKGEIVHTDRDDDYTFISAAVFTPDGRSVLSASRNRRKPEGRALKLWDVASGRLVGSLESRLGAVASLALSPDGATVLAGNPSEISFARNARQLRYSAMDGVPELLDMASRRSIGVLQSHIRPFTALAFSRDGKRFVASSYERYGNSTLHLWDAETGRQLRCFQEGGTHVTSVALSSDGGLVLAGGGLTGAGKSLRLFDAATGELRRAFDEPERLGGSYWVYAAALAPDDGSVVSAASDDREIKLWDVATGGLTRTFPAASGAVAFSSDGARMLSGAWDAPHDRLKLWEVASGSLLRSFQQEDARGINAVALSADGTRALAGSQDGVVTLWDAASEAPLWQLEGHADEVFTVAFSPDGLRAVSGGVDGNIKIWDLASGKLLQTLAGHCAAVNAAVYSPDGTRVLSASNDSTVRMWSAPSGELLATFIAGEELWLTLTPAGFFAGSPAAAELISVVRGLEARPVATVHDRLHRPDLVAQRLAGDRDRNYAVAAEGLDLDFLFRTSDANT